MQAQSKTTSIEIPQFLYGTAWKENQTYPLTRLALQRGFRAIDTANQRKHYHEAGVGEAIAEGIREGVVTRDELFLQTKFTFLEGQDERLPYDRAAPIEEQVQQSFASSLEHLQVDRIDSLLLHGPSRRLGLTDADWQAWHAMEQLYDRGLIRFLGVSNISLEQLELLYTQVRVQPTFVQNRCYAATRWGLDVREFCRAQGIIYQAFSLLTANAKIFSSPLLERIATKYQKTKAQIIFRFAIDSGLLPLTGTTDSKHMDMDLETLHFELTREEVKSIELIALTPLQ